MQSIWSGINAMKKKVLVIVLMFSLLVSFTAYYIYTGIQNRNKCEATYIKDKSGLPIGISYNGRNYYEWGYMFDNYFEPYDICAYDGFPYELVKKEDEINSEVVYIKQDKFSDYIFLVDDYFSYLSEVYDKNRDIIVVNFDPPERFFDENFVFPTKEENKVDEIWMSHSSSYEIITDKATVDKIVKCAKSDGKIELDKDIYDYIKKYSADHHCLWLKYEGYPIVEEFHIKETEDGRYIIDQYTPEEYDTIYWEEEAHQ